MMACLQIVKPRARYYPLIKTWYVYCEHRNGMGPRFIDAWRNWLTSRYAI